MPVIGADDIGIPAADDPVIGLEDIGMAAPDDADIGADDMGIAMLVGLLVELVGGALLAVVLVVPHAARPNVRTAAAPETAMRVRMVMTNAPCGLLEARGGTNLQPTGGARLR